MNNRDWSEKELQKKTIEFFEKLGYEYIEPSKCEELRKNEFRNVILKPILEKWLKKNNKITYNNNTYEFSDSSISKAINEINIGFESREDKSIQEVIYEYLMLGTPHVEGFAGKQETKTIQYIDWKNWQNNVFHVTEEFSVTGAEKNIRTDLVLFVNGIPLVIIELKAYDVDVMDAVNQIVRNNGKDYAPNLFKFATFCIASNGNNVMYGTSGTTEKFFTHWKYEVDEKERIEKMVDSFNLGRAASIQDYIFAAMLEPQRLLEVTQYFTLFDGDKKKVARYHQYYTAKKIANRIEYINPASNIRQGGTIWHTQGSGKSLTMVMIAKIILSKIKNSRVIVVTDRTELDFQIKNTFAKTKLKPTKAESGDHLLSILKENKNEVITTIINKFSVSEKEKYFDDNNNIFVLVDENHRTNYDIMADNMRFVLRKACYIGFTGTPLLKKDKTANRFGSYIRNYTINDALEDGVIVKINYNYRFVKQDVDENSINNWFETKTQAWDEKSRSNLIQKWQNVNKILSSNLRLRAIALDVYTHYENNIWSENWPNVTDKKYQKRKALLVASSVKEAVRYYNIFKSEFHHFSSVPDEPFNVELLISNPEMRDDRSETDATSNDVTKFWNTMMYQYKRPDIYEQKIKEGFLEGEIHLIIVVKKLLTGFDAPNCQVIYIDKIIKEHELLQAIARVNRIKEGKTHGLVIDYRGLIENINLAIKTWSGEGDLSNFDPKDIENAVTRLNEAVDEFLKSYEALESNFISIINKKDINEYINFLRKEDNKEILKKFYKDYNSFSDNFKTIKSLDGVIETGKITREKLGIYRAKDLWYKKLKDSLRLFGKSDSMDKMSDDEMQKLLDIYIRSDKPLEKISDTNIMNLVDNFDEEMKQQSALNSLQYALEIKAQNDIYYDNLAKSLKETLDRIEKASENILSKSYILEQRGKAIKDTYKKMENGPSKNDVPQIIENMTWIHSLYRLLKNFITEQSDKSEINDDEIAQITLEVQKKVISKIKPNWYNNESVKKSLWNDIFLYLSETTDKYGILEEKDKLVEDLSWQIIEYVKDWKN